MHLFFRILCITKVFHQVWKFVFFFSFYLKFFTKRIFYILLREIELGKCTLLSKLCILLEFIERFKRFGILKAYFYRIYGYELSTNQNFTILRFFAQMRFCKKKRKKKILDALRIKSLCCSGKFNWNIG